jgi:chorismate mutase
MEEKGSGRRNWNTTTRCVRVLINHQQQSPKVKVGFVYVTLQYVEEPKEK